MTKKLTKAQRHIAYIIMREEAERPGEFDSFKYRIPNTLSNYHGFCFMYLLLFDDDSLKDNFKKALPELYAKKPYTDSTYWFRCDKNGWQQRIKLLNQCIIETHA